MQIASFTTRHCSPVIANRELSHLRQPEALSKLQDEALSIKILSTNEVIATYVVDEHPMEIGVKIPADFPLHGVEIRDIQRVGITEAKWRSWLLAVQQLITGQNGLIFDALSLFKRNAEVQFQGMEECAICYSIISPMDRSLPTKPCKLVRTSSTQDVSSNGSRRLALVLARFADRSCDPIFNRISPYIFLTVISMHSTLNAVHARVSDEI